jgi:tRNA(Arg) A34 adenosine deaminase TadA
MGDVDAAWLALDPPWRAAFEEAWASWRAGCFGIGCVITDGGGQVVARGRNRVLERADQPGVLGGALIAHAEMNALAVLSLDLRTGENLRLYTTMEPCLMCASKLVMVRLGVVHYAAADAMFDGVEEMLRGHPYCAGRLPRRCGSRRDGCPSSPHKARPSSTLSPSCGRTWSRCRRPPRRRTRP